MILFPNCHHRSRGIIFSQIMFVSGGGAGKGGAVSFGGSTVCLGGGSLVCRAVGVGLGHSSLPGLSLVPVQQDVLSHSDRIAKDREGLNLMVRCIWSLFLGVVRPKAPPQVLPLRLGGEGSCGWKR